MTQLQLIAAEGIQEGFVLMLVGLTVVFAALILTALGITLVQIVIREPDEVAAATGVTQSVDIPSEHIAILSAVSVALLGSNIRIRRLRAVFEDDNRCPPN